ncbi:putative helicase [Methanobrevibacter arboriphilus JCM 13429 = DSM 1125]|uniref:Putative helicase n=1 Tax=Methanobrevibacter arboriphilus JCM 13429 = DSM 1125 TaxID=1300164 RepID=A0A1V6N583_METAZ|nr:ATP-dependent helicase [Methanobrevibacter arboriphilus]OQD59834.1 putative helicase [Methanobrevibacter arboriphilus JCM 13429 = DSM 1125]
MPLEKTIKWTKKQKEVISLEKNGKFVVKACPGSGKTTTISRKLFNIITNWNESYSGVATLSFTNVAADEIKERFIKWSNKSILFPHYIGTIDSFINKYIFLPYGHLVMGVNERPILVGEPHGKWHAKSHGCSYFDKFTYDINENIVEMGDYGLTEPELKEVKRCKKSLISSGYANQADANYFSMKILKNYPNVAKAIALRFPNFIIDEAQDTSDIQIKIFDILIKHGLNEIILIGDPEQAIYEWNNANPELFNGKFEEWEHNSIIFNKNFRSSEEICKVTSKLSEIEYSTGKEKNLDNISYIPEFIPYDNENINDIIQKYLKLCKKYSISLSKESVAVLYRSDNFLKEFLINNKYTDETIHSIWKSGKNSSPEKIAYTKDFLYGKFLWDNQNKLDGFKLIEKAIFEMYNNFTHVKQEEISEIIKNVGFYNHRTHIYNIINLLPHTSLKSNINEWIIKTNNIFHENNIEYELNMIKSKRGHAYFKEDLIFSDIFSNNLNNKDIKYHIGTVHSVKGKSFKAVLLFLKKQGAKGSHYKTLLKNNTYLCESEELRIVYVGMTRPEKILQVAVPTSEIEYWKNFFEDFKSDEKILSSQSTLFDVFS